VMPMRGLERVRADDGRFESLADLFRQIGCDERVHTEESWPG